jgi:hypothetical protein
MRGGRPAAEGGEDACEHQRAAGEAPSTGAEHTERCVDGVQRHAERSEVTASTPMGVGSSWAKRSEKAQATGPDEPALLGLPPIVAPARSGAAGEAEEVAACGARRTSCDATVQWKPSERLCRSSRRHVRLAATVGPE